MQTYNNLQLKTAELLTNMKGLGCTANIFQIQGYPSPPAEVIPQNLFPSSFQ